MNVWKIFLLIPLLFHSAKANNILGKFARDYYNSVNIHQIIVFGCWSDAGIPKSVFSTIHTLPKNFDGSSETLDFTKTVMDLDTVISFNFITKNMDIEKILRVNYYHVGVMLDLDCSLSDIVLDKFSDRLVFNESYFWLLFTGALTPPHHRLEHLPLSIDSEMTVAALNGSEFLLYDVYNPSYRHNGWYNTTYKGQWSRENGLINELTGYKYTRRNFHLMALNFSVALRHEPVPDLLTYMTTPTNKHFDAMHRFHYGLVLLLKEMFNFTINLHLSKTWGYMKPDGSFDGILGEMVKKVVDMSVSPYRYRAERLNVAHYTVETLVVRTMFIFRHPRSASLRNNFLKPFTDDLWWMILVVSIVYCTSLMITMKVQMHYNISQIDDLNSEISSEIALTTVAALSQQGVTEGPRIISGRIVFLSLFMWCLLLFQFYSASIVGSLLTTPPRTITTVKNLTDSSIEIGAEDVSWAPDMFKTTTIPEEKELYERKIKPFENTNKKTYLPVNEGMKNVRKGGFAFYVESSSAYKLIMDTFHEDEMCELQEIMSHAPRKTTMMLAKGSPFTKMMIYGLRKIVQHGLSSHIVKKWYTDRPRCPETHNSKPTAVKFEQFVPAIFLLIIGMSVSIFILGIEYLYYYKTKDYDSHSNSAHSNHRNVTPEEFIGEY